jgi:hypothetical protein
MGFEGSLDILWENRAQAEAVPRYGLIFARYRGFKSGAQPINRIAGTENLESYLLRIGLTAQDANHWIAKLKEQGGSVSIPNLTMRSEYMSPYEYPA